MWAVSQKTQVAARLGAELVLAGEVVEGVLDGAVRRLRAGDAGVAVPADVAQRVEPLDQCGVGENVPFECVLFNHAWKRSQIHTRLRPVSRPYG